MLRTVRVTRYVTPLREGGSLPAVVEGDDEGLYVLKFRGAGQGPLALVAELVSGEIGRALGLAIPELVFMDLDAAIGRNEADPEIRDLLIASVGLNLGMDFLPGSSMFDPAAGDRCDGGIASKAVWFDAFVTNIDRTAKNANLLLWHKKLYFIDHGASLFFHHNWPSSEGTRKTVTVSSAPPKVSGALADSRSASGPFALLDQMAANPFFAIRDHILLPWANCIADVDQEMRAKISEPLLRQILEAIPPNWLSQAEGPSVNGYLAYFEERLARSTFVEEAIRAHAKLV